jgi:transposase
VVSLRYVLVHSRQFCRRDLQRALNSQGRRGGGRHRSLTPEQIEEGIGILRNRPRMTVEAARATLRDAGINGSRSALYRLVIVPAYASGS